MDGIRVFTFAALFGLACGTAQAASTAPVEMTGAVARMVAVKDPATGVVEGFVEMALEKGWKTYWRSPGESGIPPEFDFSASSGFMPGEISFQTPEFFESEDGSFAGYKGKVQFLFKGQSLDDDTALRLEFFAGVCEEICIPSTASFEIGADSLNRSDSRALTEIAMARQALPKPPSAEFGITGTAFVDGGTLHLAANIPGQDKAALLLVEGPGHWYIPVAKSSGTDGQAVAFKVVLPEGADPAAIADAKFRYTLIHGSRSVEGLFETTPR